MYPTPVQRVTSNGGTARAKQYGFSGFCVFDCFYARGLETFQIYCNGQKTAHCSVWFGLMILLSVGDFPVSGFCHQAFPDGLLVYAFGSHPFGRFLHGVFLSRKEKATSVMVLIVWLMRSTSSSLFMSMPQNVEHLLCRLR